MSETTPDHNDRNPFTRPVFILSAALIVALIAAVLVIAFLPSGNKEPDSTAPISTASTPTPAASGGEIEKSVCGLPGDDGSALGAAPESNWELTGPMAVPYDPEVYGPGGGDQPGPQVCFSHNPTGALYAAANIFASIVYGDQLAVFKQQVAEGELRDEAISALENYEASDTTGDPQFQIAGFQLERYTASRATVNLGFEVDNGSVGSITLPLVWQGGDWKLVLEQSGPPEPQQLNDLAEFIPWSGV